MNAQEKLVGNIISSAEAVKKREALLRLAKKRQDAKFERYSKP